MIRKHFRFKRIVIGLAFAAIAAPATAQAQYYVDYGPAPVSNATTALQIRSEHSQVTPALTPQQASAAVSERSNGAPGPNSVYVPTVATSTSDSFSFRDAGIGASIAFAVALCLVTLVALGRRRRSGLDTRLTSA